jgi:hypothetical protein
MLPNQRITVVLPAYNAAQTLEKTFNEIPHDIVDDVILVDDASPDATVELARNLRTPTIRHDRNRGYGGQPENLLHGGTGQGCGHCRDAAPRLPIFAEIGNGNGVDDRFWGVRRGAGLPRSRPGSARWRDAGL